MKESLTFGEEGHSKLVGELRDGLRSKDGQAVGSEMCHTDPPAGRKESRGQLLEMLPALCPHLSALLLDNLSGSCLTQGHVPFPGNPHPSSRD